MDSDSTLSKIYNDLKPHLNERQARLLVASMANSCGYGGVTKLSKITGMSRSTINTGRKKLDEGGIFSTDKVRAEGAGRKKYLKSILNC